MFEKLIEVLAALVAAIQANTEALKGAAVSAPAEEKKSRGRPAKTETPAAPAAEPAPAPAPAPVTPSPPALTVADVRAAATALLDANGNDGTPLTALNAKYGVKRISEVAADKYAEVIEELKRLTEAAKSSPV